MMVLDMPTTTHSRLSFLAHGSLYLVLGLQLLFGDKNIWIEKKQAQKRLYHKQNREGTGVALSCFI